MKTTVILIIVILLCPLIKGQTVINSSGKNISNTTLMLTYSIGEIVVKTINNTQCILNQGFCQQNYQTVTGVNTPTLENDLNIYPNPVQNELNIVAKTRFDKITIYDINGKVVFCQKFDNKPINISHLLGGIYIIRTFDHKGDFINSFKFIKQ